MLKLFYDIDFQAHTLQETSNSLRNLAFPTRTSMEPKLTEYEKRRLKIARNKKFMEDLGLTSHEFDVYTSDGSCSVNIVINIKELDQHER
jgi:hypothetical protein